MFWQQTRGLGWEANMNMLKPRHSVIVSSHCTTIYNPGKHKTFQNDKYIFSLIGILHRDYCRTEDLLENLMHALNPFSFNNHFTLSTNIGNYFYYKLWKKNRKPDKNCCHCNWIAEFIFTLCIKTTSASH